MQDRTATADEAYKLRENPMPRRLRRALGRVLPMVALLHAYLGWRLLPALAPGVVGMTLGVALLALSTCLVPLGL